MNIEKKGFNPTEVDTYQVLESGIVIFEGSQRECLDFMFANL